MSNKFSNFEINNLRRVLGENFNVRFNKAGNITVEYLPEFLKCSERDKKFWTLYLTNDEYYLWRRHTGYGYCYPLNGKGRKRIGDIHKEKYGNKTFYWYNREWDIRNCYFNTFEDAISYFIGYLKKYKNIDVNIPSIDTDKIANNLADKLFTKEYIGKCTDSCHFDWLDWFDSTYPYRTKEQRESFTSAIENEYERILNKYYGKDIDYSSLFEFINKINTANKILNTIIKNNNYPEYLNEFKFIFGTLNDIICSLKSIHKEIYTTYFEKEAC